MTTPLNPAMLLDLRANPPLLGELATQRRALLFGDDAALVVDTAPAPVHTADDAAQWPDPQRVGSPAHALVYLRVPPNDLAQRKYLGYVDHLIQNNLGGLLVPYCDEAAASHKIWLLATARLLAPATWRVAARHDLLGIRLAQIALAFGADTLSGPVTEDRSLPLAGVTRPNETSRAGLLALVQSAGLRGTWYPSPSALLDVATR